MTKNATIFCTLLIGLVPVIFAASPQQSASTEIIQSSVVVPKLWTKLIKTPYGIILDDSDSSTTKTTLVNALLWVDGAKLSSTSILERNPAFLERSIEGRGGETSLGFASPFNAQVQVILRNTVANIALSTRSSILLLQTRLSRNTVLGYSDAARLSYINAKGVDPIDIRFGTGNVAEEKLAQDWISWRLAQVSGLVKNLSATYKAKKPNGKVAVMGSADWMRMTRGQKNTTLEDWPTWAASGLIDEIVLEGDWNVPQGRVDYAASKAALDLINAKLLATAKPKRAPIKLTVLIPLRDTNGRALDPLSQLLTLQGQGVKSIMLQVSDASDLPRANEFISQTLPSVQAMLQ